MKTATGKHNRVTSGSLLPSKRRHPRVDVQGLAGDIADGNFVFEGIVEDVSLGGLKMSNLPINFSALNRSYTTVISGKDKHYKCIVIPCWTKKAKNNRLVEVGFKIIQAPWEWTEFVLNATLPFTSAADFPSQA